MSSKKKLEQRKEFKEYLSIADKRVLDIKKFGIELIANDEVFVLVNGTHNYWTSNHGRLTNNLHGKFYMHKTGYAHFTFSGVDKKIETYTDKLVAEHFLEKPDKCNRIWHIDRNKNNCHYKNLVWVNNEEYIDLERGIMLVEELGRQQGYVPYITLKSNTAYSIWNGIYMRCYKQNNVYDGSFMCDLWRYDSKMKMYYGEIKPYGHDEVIRLSYWGTPEEAFAEYKRHKQADILIMADKYKNKVPKKVYDALLRFEVKPYVEDWDG